MNQNTNQFNSSYQHWSKHNSFIGSTADLKDHPLVKLEPKPRRYSSEIMDIYTAKLMYKMALIKKYGENFKEYMRANKLNN